MIVLYVPFPRDAAGDLTSLVNRWKANYELNSTQPVHIMFYGDDFDLDRTAPSTHYLEVYICAHGADEHPFQLANHSDDSKAQWVNMETVAERFNSDFLIVSHQISTIHCYCCGSEGKNQALARLLRTYLVRSEMPIYSYGGCLYGADSRGMLWSINGNKITPINNTAHILYDDTDQFVNEFSTRKTIKVMGQERFLERCQEKRRHQLFTFHKEKRLEAVERQRHNDNIDTTLTCK